LEFSSAEPRTCNPINSNSYSNHCVAKCHHLSGAMWLDYYFGTVTVATSQRRSTMAVNSGQRRSTVVDHCEPPPDHRSTVVDR
nr:hypothetical protein [Tanacetum cinerariifolium]